MQEKLEKLWRELIAVDNMKMDGSLPPYSSKEKREKILLLIDRLEDAIAWAAIGSGDYNL